MLVRKSFRLKTFLSALSVLLVIAGTLFGANVASADSIQVQGYQRASQSEGCVAQVGETPWQASWGPDATWKPGWEQWANAGKGGWVCTRTITWAKTPVPGSSSGGASAPCTYNVGATGPGGGLVFLVSGGLCYEMAPKTWNGGVSDPFQYWTTTAATCYASGSSSASQNCQTNNLYPGTPSEQAASTTAAAATGMGSTNTAAINARMAAGSVASSAYAAGMASSYAGGGKTDWFLPSPNELNAMCLYSRPWVGSPLAPSVGACTGVQDSTFASSAYGFSTAYYWSSAQSSNVVFAAFRSFNFGSASGDEKWQRDYVRPIRAF